MSDMGTLSVALAWAAGILLVYAVVARGLFRATDQFRQEAVEIARDIFGDIATTEHQKAAISSSLDDFHSKLAAWKIVAGMVVYVVTIPARWLAKNGAEISITDDPAREPLFDAFIARWSVATVANSPITAFLFAILVILAAALTMTGKAMGRILFDQSHHDGHNSGGPQVAHGI